MPAPANHFHPNTADCYTVTNYYDGLDRPVRIVFPDATYEQTIYNRLSVEKGVASRI